MSAPLEVTIHGAARTVTGSCYEVKTPKSRVLVDLGMFQGPRSVEQLNWQALPVRTEGLDAVVLTHAHLDHSGLLPRLAKSKFDGPIWCTPATRDLLAEMLPDAARIQEYDAERRNRRADRADEPHVEPLYTSGDAKTVLARLQVADYCEPFKAAPGVEVRFWNAGHILGAASVELTAADTKLLFSGDLGPQQKAFHPDPNAPSGVDHVFCESTYGDRDREEVSIAERRVLLESEITAALTRGGNLLIPVFALERTQELLLDLARLMQSGALKRTQVFIDSPLATRTTNVFLQYKSELEDMEGGPVFRHPAFKFTESVDESRAINRMSGAIILSASGMCEGGRIRHHLKANLPRKDSTLLFVGYQAQGTLGRVLLEGAKRVRISGSEIAVRAQVRRIDSYSAHADRQELIDWIGARAPVAGSVFLTHGEANAVDSLRRALQKDFPSIITPSLGERYALPKGAPAKRLTTGRVDLHDMIERDWQNDYAAFSVGLKKKLSAIHPVKKRREAISELRDVLTRYGGG